ncbi:DUF1002 domain-containing protein [Coprococcus catus]|uniref:DUF1002 domain-containing protein n=1 Tax=Coprococcus catus TaxID=116085 RepID=UPI001C8B9CF2|nr:DUF1002 domain-containing protein [Coprococcus catus]MBX9229964.1 DUF1002 domain-containing protein [Coprococcus catus]MCT6798975.1 DUF1002 domain-containing protein [Coprococcus catus]
MRKKIKQYVSMLMVMLMAISAVVFCGAEKAYAGSFSGGYISLGADLTSDEKAKVLALFGVDEKDLDNYKVVYVTNQEEHQYLDSYISSSQIGNQAWSSVLITEGKKGSGINVTTKNVIYCTTGMYANALATAGVEDVNVVVAGPFNVSGTAALVGALKAYSEMTGETVDEDVVDAAVDEMVTTGSLEDGTDADNEKIEGMVAYLKEQIANSDNKDKDLDQIINDAANKFEITLNEDQFNQLKSLLEKLGGLHLDLGSLKSQAQAAYDTLKDMGFDISKIHIDTEEARGLLQQIIETIKGWFN